MTATARSEAQDARQDRLIPFIAAERALRCVVLVAIGIALLTHTHTDWGGWFSHLARSLGFDPRHNTLGRLIGKLNHLTPGKLEAYGAIAVAYGLLEGCEAYGLFRRRPWGEYLTVVATAILLIPEVDEIAKKVSVLKVAALLLNIAVVVYLIVRIVRARRRAAQPSTAG